MELYDVFAIGVGMRYYETKDFYLQAEDEVTVQGSQIIKNGNIIGSLARNNKYYDEGTSLLDTFVKYKCYVPKGDYYAVLTSDEIAHYCGNTKGKVIYASPDIALIYLGTKEGASIGLDEDWFDDDTVFTLTEKGTQLLGELLNSTGMHDIPMERKEENRMDNVFGKIGFGKCTDSRFALSINGIAVRQPSGKFVVYNKDTNEFVETGDMLLNIKDALFALPAIEVNIGDTIIHENKPYYITDTAHGIKAVSYEDCTETTLIPKTTMFGLKYFTKVFSIFGDNFASAGELFNNPMMLMALMDNKDTDLSKLLMLSSFGKMDNMNPMFLSLLLKDGNTDLSTIAMMSMFNGGNNPFAPKSNKKAPKETTN